MIKISAIVCTFKRPEYLRQALRSLCEQTLPPEDYEIVIVDNAVDSETNEVVKQFQDGRVNLRYVIEGEVGLSRARNTGLAFARAPYVAYMDDDARAEANWLEALLRAFERTSPVPAAVGGRVWLDWQDERPTWIPDEHLSLYTHVDHGEAPHLLRNDEYLVGANLAFEKAALNSIGGFDPDLGRQGSLLLSGEEGLALRELNTRGLGIQYEPEAVVWHSVHPSRKRPTWLLKRMFWDGASQPLLDNSTQRRSRAALLRGACSDLRQCLRWFASALTATVSGKKNSAWESVLGLSQRAGRLRTQMRLLAWNRD